MEESLEKIINEAKSLIASSKLERAIELIRLASVQFSNLRVYESQILMISMRHKNFLSNKIMGINSENEINLIVNDLIVLLNLITYKHIDYKDSLTNRISELRKRYLLAKFPDELDRIHYESKILLESWPYEYEIFQLVKFTKQHFDRGEGNKCSPPSLPKAIPKAMKIYSHKLIVLILIVLIMIISFLYFNLK